MFLKNNKLVVLFNLFITVFFANFKRAKQPFKLTFSITNRCNSRCKTCNIWKSKKNIDLGFNHINNFFKKNNHFKWIDLTGGEVFLRTDLFDIAKVIKETQKDIYLFHIPTNGLLTEKVVNDVKNIIDLKFPKFLMTISLDGPKDVHDNIRGIKGNWEKSISLYKELKKFKSSSFDCYFGYTVSKYNYNQIDNLLFELRKEIKGITCDDIHFNLAHYTDSYYKNIDLSNNLLQEQKILNTFKEILSKSTFKMNPVYILEKMYQGLVSRYLQLKKFPLNTSCRAGEISIFIDESGDIHPCSMWNKKINNLKEIDYDLLKLEKIDTSFCTQCWTPCEAYQNIMVSFLKNNKLK